MKNKEPKAKVQKKPRSRIFTNLVLAIIATVAQGWINHDFGIGNIVVCFIVAFGLLSLVDFLDKMVKSKMEKKLAKESIRDSIRENAKNARS